MQRVLAGAHAHRAEVVVEVVIEIVGLEHDYVVDAYPARGGGGFVLVLALLPGRDFCAYNVVRRVEGSCAIFWATEIACYYEDRDDGAAAGVLACPEGCGCILLWMLFALVDACEAEPSAEADRKPESDVSEVCSHHARSFLVPVRRNRSWVGCVVFFAHSSMPPVFRM
jgi:hypothetical protein